jgi:hypothetical protein
MYSLGSVLAFMLTGQAAVDAATAAARLKEQPDVPAELIALCTQMMADKPAERLPKMGRVLEQLAPIVRQLVAAAKKSKQEEVESSRAAVVPIADQAATEPAAKSQKPVVAKPLGSESPVEIVIPGVTHEVMEVTPAEAPVIKTRGRAQRAPPPAKPAANVPEAAAADVAASPHAATYRTAVLASAIGGGVVLALALIIAVVCFWLAGRNKAKTVADNPAAATTAAPAVRPQAESNPVAAPSETNPVEAVESNPKIEANVPVVGEPDQPVAEERAAPAAAATEEKAAVEPKVESSPENKSEESPAPPKKAEAKAPSPPAAKPAVKAAAKLPAKVEPFQGLAAAVSLPALTDGSGQAASDPPAAVVLGKYKPAEGVPLTASLLGGESAVRGTKHKFELQARAGQPQVWEILLTGAGQPITVATLTGAADSVSFQWTEEAVKQAAVAKQLCNCTVELTAGGAKHALGLRTPVMGSPLIVDVEKPVSTKLTIGDLPIGKQVFVEVTRVEGIKDTQVEPKQVATGEEIWVWLGDAPKSFPLAAKLATSSNARDVEIKQQAYVKLDEQEPQIYRRKDLLALHQASLQQFDFISMELKKKKDSRPRQEIERQLRDQIVEGLAKQQLTLGNVMEHINFATGFAEKHHGSVLVHFRVYYQAGETKLDLYRSEEAPPKGSKK